MLGSFSRSEIKLWISVDSYIQHVSPIQKKKNTLNEGRFSQKHFDHACYEFRDTELLAIVDKKRNNSSKC